jgi:hypothetical protein
MSEILRAVSTLLGCACNNGVYFSWKRDGSGVLGAHLWSSGGTSNESMLFRRYPGWAIVTGGCGQQFDEMYRTNVHASSLVTTPGRTRRLKVACP